MPYEELKEIVIVYIFHRPKLLRIIRVQCTVTHKTNQLWNLSGQPPRQCISPFSCILVVQNFDHISH
jgi:hypothetical protein